MRALLLALLLVSCATVAEPLAQIANKDIRISLYSGPCELPAVVNLPHRAEWTAKGKTFAGCWSINSFGLVVMVFDDKTAVSIPAQMFTRAQGV